MGLIGRVLSFIRTTRNVAGQVVNRTDVKVNPGGGDNLTPIHSSSPGLDAHPLTLDDAVLIPDPRRGGWIAVGYFDVKTVQKASQGEVRLYARDSAGDIVNEVFVKNDGAIVLENSNGTFELTADGSIKGNNSNGSFELQAAGDFVVNGVTIDTNGNISGANNITASGSIAAPSMVVNGRELDLHTHPIVSGSSAPGPTGPNN